MLKQSDSIRRPLWAWSSWTGLSRVLGWTRRSGYNRETKQTR